MWQNCGEHDSYIAATTPPLAPSILIVLFWMTSIVLIMWPTLCYTHFFMLCSFIYLFIHSFSWFTCLFSHSISVLILVLILRHWLNQSAILNQSSIQHVQLLHLLFFLNVSFLFIYLLSYLFIVSKCYFEHWKLADFYK